jgi:FKBP-type peptidyl-prolyl cis-trans isomerase (trigger factor)
MAKTQKHYADIKVTPLPEREIEVIGSITAEKMALMRGKALAKLKEGVEIQGFRKGNAPDALVAQKIGEGTLLEEAAEMALSEEYPNILDEHEIDAIGRPEIQITKIGIGSPMEFKIKTSLMPEVKLADYRKIAKKALDGEKKELAVTDAEMNEVIETVRKNIAHEELHRKHGHDHKHGEIEAKDLPEINDEFVKSYGGFKNVEDFKAKIRENILIEKKLKEKDKARTEILEEIMDKSAISLPKIIVDGESEKMLAQFEDDVVKSGIPMEEYLKHIKKTREDLKNDWKDTAVKRAKSQVILNTIAKEEGIAPEEAEVKKEMENILSHYKDAERFRVRMYVETFLTNELVFKFLESLS